MTALRIVLLTTAATFPVLTLAQQMDPSMPMPGMEAPAKTVSTAARPPRGKGGMGAGPSSADPHAGHDMGDTGGMAGMGGAQREMPNAPSPPAALSGPAHAADLFYAPSVMAAAREDLRAEQGDLKAYRVLVDRLETQFQRGRDGYRWDLQGWYGGDIDKLWIKSEGNGAYGGKLGRAEVQALWSRAITPWFDLQAGVRHDFRPNPQRTHAVLGLQGLVPYSYNTEAALFLSNKGELTARVNADYDLLITQRLILQPRVEANFSAQNIRELGIGSGLSTIELGLRLRYEFIPEFAPYVGVEYERSVGTTASYARASGQGPDSVRYLVGLRSWF
ncbi:copper resistance protein B [Methylobacterium aquaticum]|jgi:copper resistance protein B|uniref:Copper resistance protein n=1 Tax=Methylobacterium aquaticum TaxID=270351 RepID=A0A0J6SI10_9HYPH|nr:copper resistance protein B [Methylobacterium aquaticum]KMO33357.1 copper resistance protein [Methylobacterium aquaticum]